MRRHRRIACMVQNILPDNTQQLSSVAEFTLVELLEHHIAHALQLFLLMAGCPYKTSDTRELLQFVETNYPQVLQDIDLTGNSLATIRTVLHNKLTSGKFILPFTFT